MEDKLLDVISADEYDKAYENSKIRSVFRYNRPSEVNELIKNIDKMEASFIEALAKVGELSDPTGKRNAKRSTALFLNQLSSDIFNHIYEFNTTRNEDPQVVTNIKSIERSKNEKGGLYSFILPEEVRFSKTAVYTSLEIFSKITNMKKPETDTVFGALYLQNFDKFFYSKCGLIKRVDRSRKITRKMAHSVLASMSISVAKGTVSESYTEEENDFKYIFSQKFHHEKINLVATILARRFLNKGLMIPFDITKVKQKTIGMGKEFTHYYTSLALAPFNAIWCSYSKVVDDPEEKRRLKSQILAFINTDKALQVRREQFEENQSANDVVNEISEANFKKLTNDSTSPKTLSFFHGCYNLINYIKKSESLKKIEVVRKPTKKVVTPTREPTKEKGKEPEVAPSRPEPSRKIVRKGEESSLIEIEKVSTFTNNMFDGFSKLSENDPAISILRNDVKKYSEMGTEKFKAFIAKMGGGYFKVEEKRLKRGTKRELIYTGIQIRDEYIQSRVYANDLIREKGCSGSVISVKERRGITTNQYESPKKGKAKKKYSNKFVFPKGVYPVDE